MQKASLLSLIKLLFIPMVVVNLQIMGLSETIISKLMSRVTQYGDQIRHYIEFTTNTTLEAQKVSGVVDQKRRLTNARYHTAGHLLSNIVEILNPKLKAMKGHSFPGEAYVEFQGDEAIDVGVLQNAINAAIAKNDTSIVFGTDRLGFEKQFYKLPYSIPDNKNFRVMQIGDMAPVPCGGTHLSSIGEIGIYP